MNYQFGLLEKAPFYSSLFKREYIKKVIQQVQLAERLGYRRMLLDASDFKSYNFRLAEVISTLTTRTDTIRIGIKLSLDPEDENHSVNQFLKYLCSAEIQRLDLILENSREHLTLNKLKLATTNSVFIERVQSSKKLIEEKADCSSVNLIVSGTSRQSAQAAAVLELPFIFTGGDRPDLLTLGRASAHYRSLFSNGHFILELPKLYAYPYLTKEDTTPKDSLVPKTAVRKNDYLERLHYAYRINEFIGCSFS
ncbi:hypothetical protein [Jeotgalibacillus proteolyticus]|uniref:Uncharacterized protein n=1 Tax=Jeotgalibacillus proteolyticus TaxID=2082395 RepID=A0A2S5G7X7_9BACL|nr:hypothetical protein [Jeotgalibacillus proteolyticus]PPA69043.1 hypothetical protein C4B60_17150 [Jeotgalibacillus proteolyticus]